MKNLGFKDLVFKKHLAVPNGVIAKLEFDNGEWISVVGGGVGLYGNGVTSFEIMSSSTEKTKRGVKGYLSKEQVNRHIKYLQAKYRKGNCKNKIEKNRIL